jgi:hypothetical protein
MEVCMIGSIPYVVVPPKTIYVEYDDDYGLPCVAFCAPAAKAEHTLTQEHDT